jgi:CRISPR-associated protein Csh1
MEWLQTYKIGKLLLETGIVEPVDAFFEVYKPQKIKDSIYYKNTYILPILIDIDSEFVILDDLIDFTNEKIKEDNFFTTVSANFSSFYLSTNISKKNSILDFFGITYQKQKEPEKTNEKNIFIEIEKLKKNKLIDKNFSDAKLIQIRNQINKNKNICFKIRYLIENLDKILTKKGLDFHEQTFLTEKEKNNYTYYPKLEISKNGKDEISFITVSVVVNKEKIDLNTLDEYRQFCYARFLNLAGIQNNNNKDEEEKNICYFNKKSPVFSANFPRDSIDILKMFTGSPTTLPYFVGDSYQINKETFDALKTGSHFIENNLKIYFGGIQNYIIPDFNQIINIDSLKSELKPNLELAFQLDRFDKTQKHIYRACDFINSIVFLGFIQSERDIDFTSIVKIDDIKYFEKVIIEFIKCVDFFDKMQFSFKQIYFLFPESGKITKCSNSITIYKSIFERTPIDKNFIFNNYKKLIAIYRYGNPESENGSNYAGTKNISCRIKNQKFEPLLFDIKISFATKKYLVLFNLMNKLFNMNEITNIEIDKLNEKTFNFFKESRYESDAKKAMFFMGKIIRVIASAQSKKQKNYRKPILDKINYSGMRIEDIKWLKCELIEKLKQYDDNYHVFKHAENDLMSFEYYFGKAESLWDLTDVENVFYLFTGYAMYWEVIEKNEKLEKILKSSETDELNEDDKDSEDGVTGEQQN